MTARYCMLETPFGTCGIAWSETALLAVQLPEGDETATEARLCRRTGLSAPSEPAGIAVGILSQLDKYFAGEPVDLTAIPLDLSGMSAPGRKIYTHVRNIPWGRLETYGQVAEIIGQPGGAQAVGQAMGSNPVPIVIPCHRVVAANGKLGGFSAHGGNRFKAKLLQHEQARLHQPDDPQLSLL